MKGTQTAKALSRKKQKETAEKEEIYYRSNVSLSRDLSLFLNLDELSKK